MIDSRWYSNQDPNDLTIHLHEEISGVEGVRIIFAGIPCTFYNISQELGNNNLLIHDSTAWKYVNIPDGLYDSKSFDKQISVQLKVMGLHPRAIKFDVDETTGKLIFSYRKQKGNSYKISIRSYNKDMLGFDIPPTTGLELPRKIRDPGNRNNFIDEEISIGDSPVNFKPFEFYHIHCDIVDTNDVLYNGERSDLLVRIPVKECRFGERSVYYLTGLRDRKCDERFNKIRIWLTDEDNKPINFNGGGIQYELLFKLNPPK